MRPRARILWLARIGSVAVVLVLAAFAVLAGLALERTHEQATETARAQLESLSDAVHLHDLLYQRGYTSEYLLTGDARWLSELEAAATAFRAWLDVARRDTRSPVAAGLIEALSREFATYDVGRDRAIAAYRAGQSAEAIDLTVANRRHAASLRSLAGQLLEVRRAEIAAQLDAAHQSFRRTLGALGVFVVLALALAAAIGFVLAQRLGRPLYELVLRVESSAGPRVEVHGDDEIARQEVDVVELVEALVDGGDAIAYEAFVVLDRLELYELEELRRSAGQERVELGPRHLALAHALDRNGLCDRRLL